MSMEGEGGKGNRKQRKERGKERGGEAGKQEERAGGNTGFTLN